MYIKTTRTTIKKKNYVYVKVARAHWDTNVGSKEEIIATLGTLPEVLESRETLLTGLGNLQADSSRQNKAPLGSFERPQLHVDAYRQRKKR